MAQGPYQHLLEGERRVIAHMLKEKASLRDISKATGRSPSTISREIKRNLHHNGHHAYYTHSKAQQKAISRRSHPRQHSYFSKEELDLVDQRIRMNWSPDQVSKTLAIEGILNICHETIYQHIYKDKKAGGSLCLHLRHRCRKKRKRYRSNDSRGVLRGKLMIQDRPQDINDRTAIGHWEIDTVLGDYSRVCVVTLVERKTGYLCIGRLQSRTTAELNHRVISIIKQSRMPFLSITADNGTEFHGYKEIEESTGTLFFFATPHHAWERGTNENTNGLIRQYLPKGKSMHWITQRTCDTIAHEINTRPRKRLFYQTPIKALEGAA
jgi:IS30 family transposase